MPHAAPRRATVIASSMLPYMVKEKEPPGVALALGAPDMRYARMNAQ